MKQTTTMEQLNESIRICYGSVVKYGDHVLVTDITYKGDYTADIYEFIETPEETGFGEIECRLNHIGRADQTFPDSGHALAWAIDQVNRI